MNTACQPKTINEAIAMARRTNEAKRNVSYSGAGTKRFVSRGGSEGHPTLRDGFVVALIAFTAMFMAWFLFAADFADAAAYKGKTKGGSSITFNAKGKRVTGLNMVVPTICLQTGGSYGSSAGAETYRPPRAVIGRTVKSKALQPAAMNFGVDVTKFYEVKLKRKGRAIGGKLRLSYSYFISDLWNPRTYICSGSTTFSARPR